MCNRNMFKPKTPNMEAMKTATPAQGAQSAQQERPDLDIEDEGSTRVKRESSRRSGLRIDINMGGGGRSSRGVNLPR